MRPRRESRFPRRSTAPDASLRLCGRGRSKIWLLGTRDLGLLARIIFMRVLGADEFRPCSRRAPIGHARRPRPGEDAFILDREFELQRLALVARVDAKPRVVERYRDVFLERPLLRLLGRI